jgi:hypothetical protein
MIHVSRYGRIRKDNVADDDQPRVFPTVGRRAGSVRVGVPGAVRSSTSFSVSRPRRRSIGCSTFEVAREYDCHF